VIFFKKNWKKYRSEVILLSLLLWVPVPVGADGAPSVSGNGVSVTVHSRDASGAEQDLILKQEVEQLRSTVSRLTLENKTLREEKAIQHRELIELTIKYQKQNESLRQTQLVLAGALSQTGVRKSGKREDQLLQTLAHVSRYGGELALQTVQFCEFVNSLMPDMPIGYLKRSELQSKLNAARMAADRFNTFTSEKAPESSLAKCRILAVDHELGCVVLNAGAAHGAFHGMLYYVGKQVTLRVVDVRPFVTAAIPVSGSIKDLAPGMEAVTEKKE